MVETGDSPERRVVNAKGRKLPLHEQELVAVVDPDNGVQINISKRRAWPEPVIHGQRIHFLPSLDLPSMR